jgi:hypothetical protein
MVEMVSMVVWKAEIQVVEEIWDLVTEVLMGKMRCLRDMVEGVDHLRDQKHLIARCVGRGCHSLM